MRLYVRRLRFAPLLLLALFALSSPGRSLSPHLPTASESEETVAFNTSSLKYHCLTCTWAVRCTRNCVEVSVSEAKRRGGIACKVCGGSCRR